MKQRIRWLALAATMLLASRVHAQLSPVSIPKRVFRIELGGEFTNADSRFHDGTTEDLARSFTGQLGSGFFPTLAASEARIGAIIDSSSYRLNAGNTSANGLMNIGVASIGVSYGLTRNVTLFTTVPIVRTRMQLKLDLDSTNADAGINPNDPALGTGAGQDQTAAFFAELNAALATLSGKITNGDYNSDPAMLALAQQTLADGTSLQDGLQAVFNDPQVPIVPTASSTTGTAITDSVSGLQATFNSLSVPGFSTLPALATNRLSEADFDNLIANPAGPIRGFPLRDANLNLLGDIEAGVAWTVKDSWNQAGKLGGFRAALTGTVRFPTGALDRPDDFLDIGTGSGHAAARLTGTVDLGRGRWGARLNAGYERGFAATLERRVSGPFQPIAFANRLTNIRRKPGGLLEVAATPFFRLAPTLALMGGVRLRRRSQDQVSFASDDDVLPGVDPSVMGQETGWNLSSFQAGVTYMSPAATDLARSGFPVEASWMVEGPLSGSGGIKTKERVMRVQFRMYLRLFD